MKPGKPEQVVRDPKVKAQRVEVRIEADAILEGLAEQACAKAASSKGARAERYTRVEAMARELAAEVRALDLPAGGGSSQRSA